jgi:hypothetical protein
MTSIPYEIEPVSVGTKPRDLGFGDKSRNERSAFPHAMMKYTVECRLRIDRYTRPEANVRCMQIHGTTFDGMFQSGSFYTFWSRS